MSTDSIIWVLGEELPRSTDLTELTCHAGDDLSVAALMDTLMMSVMTRAGYLRHRNIERWTTKHGPVLHVFLDRKHADSRNHHIAIERMMKNGERLGMTLTIYESYPTGDEPS